MWENLDRPPLDGAALGRALVDGPRRSWARVDVVARTGSTNADLLAVAGTAADRTALVADHQESGRGRHSRPFTAPARSQVAVSALLKLPGIAPSALGWMPLVTGIVTVDVLRTVAEVDAVLKWPNDVLVSGGKVAGILVEVATTKPVPTVVTGVGINVSLTTEELPVPTATSLQLENAAVIDRGTLVRAFLRGLGSTMDEWAESGWDTTSIAAAYRDRCDTLGRRVKVTMPGDVVLHGVATDVDGEGRLIVTPDPDGSGGSAVPVAVSAGDVTHLRVAEPTPESGRDEAGDGV